MGKKGWREMRGAKRFLRSLPWLPALLLLALAGTPVRGDLLTHLPLDGDLIDEGPAGNDGVFNGGDPAFEDGFDGTPGGALTLDGVDDYVLLQDNQGLPLTHHDAFTVAMWVKGFPAPDKRVFAESSDADANPIFSLGTHNAGADGSVDEFVRALPGTIRDHIHSTGTAFDGTWHHIAWVDDLGHVTLYIDGIPDSTNFDYPRPAQEMVLTTLGGIYRPTNDPASCCFFTGAIDDVRLYDSALTPAEVEALVPERDGCPGDADTTVADLIVDGPPNGRPGLYTFTAAGAQDASGDPILYTFTAVTGNGEHVQAGPTFADTAQLRLGPGKWTATVEVDDDLRCRDRSPQATVTKAITVFEAPRVLRSRWAFDGDLSDQGSFANHGGSVGPGQPAFGPDRRGSPDGSLCLDGSDNFVRCNLGGDQTTYDDPTLGAYTVAAWVKGLPQADRRIYAESSSLEDDSLFDIGTQQAGTTGQVDIYIRNAASEVIVDHVQSQGIAFDGTWHHIAWVDALGDAVLYIDGTRDATSFRYAWQQLDLDIVTIGGILRSNLCCRFEGCLDDVRIYEYGLSEAEVKALVAGTPPPPIPTGLTAAAGDSQVALDWDDAPDAAGYAVYRDGVQASPALVTASSWLDTGLANGTRYCYTVRAVGTDGETEDSAAACATPQKPAAGRWKRCDTNADGKNDLSDAVLILNFLFVGVSKPPACLEALNCNGDGKLDLTDAILDLGWLFQGEKKPPEPYDRCGDLHVDFPPGAASALCLYPDADARCK
jgi:hypothetical protein